MCPGIIESSVKGIDGGLLRPYIRVFASSSK
jgi:hypothetical protein